ncbi:hypothetical protein P168DRAFT_306132 [Aspergillus campestris IBT 28561]|uniref:Fungal specific transcription factor n=1 Tax=Aspergillus campestris (strain IBT 28561) TaxID=1392248 RepID=A0A2I1CW90_ASPC2|nr:uncharacterized protein P168DRAFT_306132 [Aspergillus campestris IBT 28561]PKY01879.1 hypothetical protein P168DRAFT_306132 [Aspergillus campestris IBT 28561]
MPHHRATLLPILLSPLLSAPVHAASHSAVLHAIQPSAAFLSSSSSSLPTRPARFFSQSPNTQLYSILNAQCPAPFSTPNHHTHPTPTPAYTKSRSHSTMSSTPETNTTTNNKTPTDSQPASVNSEEYLALPDASSTASGTGTTKLDISEGGSTVKLDHMGPLVVNQDGSLSRIANWDQMAEIEKKNTLRVLGKRNKARLEALRKKDGEGEGN